MSPKYSLSDLRDLLKSRTLFIFDFDGTLVDLEQLNVEAFNKVSTSSLGHEVTVDIFKQYISGASSKQGFINITQLWGVSEYDIDQLVKDFRSYKNSLLQSDPAKYSRLIGGVDRYLERLKADGMLCAVASSSGLIFVEYLLKFYKVWELFDHVVTSEQIKRNKPDPQAFQLVLDHFGSPTGSSVAFEDSLKGLQSAKNANLLTVGIKNEKWNGDFVYELSDCVIESYLSLLEEN